MTKSKFDPNIVVYRTLEEALNYPPVEPGKNLFNVKINSVDYYLWSPSSSQAITAAMRRAVQLECRQISLQDVLYFSNTRLAEANGRTQG